jgi:hypothetical protein
MKRKMEKGGSTGNDEERYLESQGERARHKIEAARETC